MNLPADNAEIAQHLRLALEAIGRADGEALRGELSHIVTWQEQPLLAGLSRLSRELGQALGELPPVDAAVGELPDACARLDKVVEMTEQAAGQTLDLVEDSQRLMARIAAGDADAEVMAKLRANLSEMALAQSYQDLTGQIIRKVAGIVRRVHDQLTALGLPPGVETPAADADAKGHGPAVPGVDRPAVSQDDADALLSNLGF